LRSRVRTEGLGWVAYRGLHCAGHHPGPALKFSADIVRLRLRVPDAETSSERPLATWEPRLYNRGGLISRFYLAVHHHPYALLREATPADALRAAPYLRTIK